ncbi:MAG: GAF domain-containing protein [Nitratireductor sp.]|nr:GAF domain-containing protein [Nitratireductor sp.]
MDTGNPLIDVSDWSGVGARIGALVEGEEDDIAKMATIACELHHAFDRFHWTGFYRNVGNETLKIGPYQGGHGCLVIPFSRGVCGACATRGETLIVDDVEAFPDHIACSSSTRSEIVVPVWKEGALIAVLDIDSDFPAAFSHADRVALETILANAFDR